jgi:hypothetical protein
VAYYYPYSGVRAVLESGLEVASAEWHVQGSEQVYALPSLLHESGLVQADCPE